MKYIGLHVSTDPDISQAPVYAHTYGVTAFACDLVGLKYADTAPQTVWMLVVSGILLAVGALFVWNIHETFGSQRAKA